MLGFTMMVTFSSQIGSDSGILELTLANNKKTNTSKAHLNFYEAFQISFFI